MTTVSTETYIPRRAEIEGLKTCFAISAGFIIPSLIKQPFMRWPATLSITVSSGVLAGSLVCKWMADRPLPLPKKVEQVVKPVLQSIGGQWKVLTDFQLLLCGHLAYPYFLVHEGGHYLAARTFFGQARIIIQPFVAGLTQHDFQTLTCFGRLLGAHRSFLVTVSGGMIASTVFAVASIAIAYSVQKRHAKTAYALKLIGRAQILQEIIYNLGYFKIANMPLYHDMDYLVLYGRIHPMIPLGILFTIPLVDCALHYLNSIQQNSPQSVDQ
ncbi:MAG: hypothetical protein Tsb0021_08660 [Chlamydiales bacterium]